MTSPLRAPGIALGVGLGGFVDGIVLHQILQWHHLLSSTDTDRAGVRTYSIRDVRGLEVNTLWDGLFHAFTWVAVVVGVALLWSRARSMRDGDWSTASLWGWVLVGWGAFNLVEGIVDHHLLAIHHVRAGPHQTLYDVGFLVFGVALVAAGLALERRRHVPASTSR